MPDHVLKILNGAYWGDKHYNDIMLHLEREMRLNGLGAPDEVTILPLNKIEPTQPTKVQKFAKHTDGTQKRVLFLLQ